MKRTRQKLTLERETLRELTAQDLGRVYGGTDETIIGGTDPAPPPGPRLNTNIDDPDGTSIQNERTRSELP